MRNGLVSGSLMLCAACAFASVTVTNLGTLPSWSESQGSGISDDGLIAVGGSGDSSINYAFRWTSEGGMQALPVPPDTIGSFPYSLSRNGVYAAGEVNLVSGGQRAARWTSNGVEDIGTLPDGTRATAYGISGDGAVVVGSSATASNYHAFRWSTAAGMQDLGTFAGGSESVAYAANDDGSVVVGWSDGPGGVQSFRWSSATGMIALSTGWSYALDVSGDGSVIVGYFGEADRIAAFRWTQAGGMQSLAQIGNATDSYSRGVSADGKVVVGSSGGRAFFWTEQTGTLDLNLYLASLGADLSGWDLRTAIGVNADGSAITGIGEFDGAQRAWVVRGIPRPLLADVNCDGAVNNFDIDPFILALTIPSQYDRHFPDCDLQLADVNGDGFVDNFDIDHFVMCIVNGRCASRP